MDETHASLRFATFLEWRQRCVWGHEPIAYDEMELDHLIPKSLAGQELSEALEMHSLPDDYDLESTRNKVPACRQCNGIKSKRIPPLAPGLTFLLEDAARRAPLIEEHAKQLRGNWRVGRLLGELESMAEQLTDTQRERLLQIGGIFSLIVSPQPEPVRIHHAIDYHDYVPPATRDAAAIITFDEFLELLKEWLDTDRYAIDVFAGAWGGDDEELNSLYPAEIDRLEYSDEVDAFLVRVICSVEYTHYDEEGTGGPADTTDVFDLWVTLNDDRSRVVEVVDAPMGTFPD